MYQILNIITLYYTSTRIIYTLLIVTIALTVRLTYRMEFRRAYVQRVSLSHLSHIYIYIYYLIKMNFTF